MTDLEKFEELIRKSAIYGQCAAIEKVNGCFRIELIEFGNVVSVYFDEDGNIK